MSISPTLARLAFCGFLAIAGGTALNILYLQDQSAVASAARTNSERAKQRAEAERARRLALAPKEALPVQAKGAPSGQRAEAVAGTPGPHATVFQVTAGTTTGTVTPGRPGRAAPADPPLPSADADSRMPEVVKAIQLQLGQRGYEPGSSDGVIGLVTRAAIMAYEHDQGLPLTAEPSEALLRHMQGVPGARGITARAGRPQRSQGAEQIIRSVQQSLAQLGYFNGRIDGTTGEDTVRAVREYEMDVGLVLSGRISAPLIVRLARSTSGISTRAVSR